MRINKLFAAASALPLLLPLTAAGDNTPLKTASEESAIVLHAQPPVVEPDGTTSFIIDISDFGLLQYMQLLNADRMVILFRGNPVEPEKNCPYIELNAHPYEIRQIDPEKYIFRVKTKAEPVDIKRVESAGCMITKAISRREIKPYINPT